MAAIVSVGACAPAETRGPEVVLPPAGKLVAPPAATKTGPSASLAGTYRWADGRIVLEVRDGKLTGANGKTSLTCTGESELTCTWEENGDEGWARFHRDGEGNLSGEYGAKGSHDVDGTWVLTRVLVHDGFTGEYTSTYGDVTLRESGRQVAGTYDQGTLTCTVQGDVLDCDWVESSTRGKAKLVRQRDGSIKGTWGDGASFDGGGDWEMEPK